MESRSRSRSPVRPEVEKEGSEDNCTDVEDNSLSENLSLSECPDMRENTDLNKNPDLSENPDFNENPDLSENPDLNENPDLSENLDLSENPDLNENPDLSENPDSSESPALSENQSENKTQVEQSFFTTIFNKKRRHIVVIKNLPQTNNYIAKKFINDTVKFSVKPYLSYVNFLLENSTDPPVCVASFRSQVSANEACEQLNGLEVDGVKLEATIVERGSTCNTSGKVEHPPSDGSTRSIQGPSNDRESVPDDKNKPRICYYCREQGHVAYICPRKNRPQTSARTVNCNDKKGGNEQSTKCEQFIEPKRFRNIQRIIQNLDETYGLSKQFLASLDITPPLVPNITVSNFAGYTPVETIKEMFSLAGRILDIVRRMKQKCVFYIAYDHPVEAVQAISMFHNQYYYGKKLIVEMNKSDAGYKIRIPPGLSKIGPGLGEAGGPLYDVRMCVELQAIKQRIQAISNNSQDTNRTSNTEKSSAWTTETPNAGALSANNLVLSNPNPNNTDNTQLMQTLLQALIKETNSSLTAQNVAPNVPNPMTNVPNPMANVQNPMTNVPNPMTNVPNPMTNVSNAVTNFPNPLTNIPNPMINAPNPTRNVPNAMSNVPHAMTNLPHSMTNVPHGMTNVPQAMTNVPHAMTNVPHAMTNVPHAMTNVPYAMTNVPNVSSFSSNLPTNPPHPTTLEQGPQSSWQTPQGNRNNFTAPTASQNQPHYSEPNVDSKRYEQSSSSYHSDSRKRDARGNSKDNSSGFDSSKHSNMVLFKYLPPYLTLSDLKAKMGEIGEIKFAELTGHGKAVMRFAKSRDADTCIKLFDQSKVDGQTIKVQYF